MPPDVLYYVRPGETNDELRYSLRSLRNLPHGRVVLAGFIPRWVDRDLVVTVPTKQRAGFGAKHQNAERNLFAALDELGHDDDFLLFNDDFYICRPMDYLPLFHNGPLDDWIERHGPGRYRSAAEGTRDVLTALGLVDTYAYELHVPMPMGRMKLQLAFALGSKVPALHYRTLYGNLFNVDPGTYIEAVYGQQW